MTAAELVRDRLLSVSAVTALVSTRVWTQLMKPGSTMPCVVVRDIDDNEVAHLRGMSGVIRARVQVDTVAAVKDGGDPFETARDLLEACDGPGDGTALAGFAGTVAGSPGVEVLAILPAGVVPTRTPQDEQEYVIQGRDYFVTYRRH